MGLFSKKILADGAPDKGRRRDRFFRSSTSHSNESNSTSATTAGGEPHDPVVTKIAHSASNKSLLLDSDEPRKGAVLTSVASADSKIEASVGTTKQAVLTRADIVNRALDQLDEKSIKAIKPYINTANSNVLSVLDSSLTAVRAQKQTCDDKRWTLTFGERTIVVKERVDKITAWMNRFKNVGDLIANSDPIHAGLPWAGIRLLLEASMVESNQMAALLVGCDTALYMMNRLKVYLDFLDGVPVGQSRGNLEQALIRMCASVLDFLGRALQIYRDPTWRRTLRAFWEPGDVANFEGTCKSLGHEVEIEASNADRTISDHDREVLQGLCNKMEDALNELQRLNSVQVSLNRIEKKMDLSKLRTVPGAVFDSHDQIHVACHSSTRRDVLDQIRAWAQDPNGKSIFWLAGMAGTGKSTVSVSVCEWLKQQEPDGIVDLGASFFFKRGEGDRVSSNLLIPTIVGELVHKISRLDNFVAQALEVDICSKRLAEQFNKLMLEPLKHSVLDAQSPTLIVVVDALDECANVEDIETMLALWQGLSVLPRISLRLFVTSRPELSIQQAFLNAVSQLHPDIELHQIPHSTVHNDILTYLKDSLSVFRDRFNKLPPTGVPLQEDWPTQSELLGIVDIAVPLFIVAATIHRFLTTRSTNPKKQLSIIMSRRTGGQMAQTYMPVLEQFARFDDDSVDRSEVGHEFRVIVGTIVCLGEPLSRIALADLLDLDNELMTLRLNDLRSVLQIPTDVAEPVRPLHLSFGEFLMSTSCVDKAFRVDAQVTHLMLSQRCLRLLSGTDGLREDICNLKHPGHLRQDVSPALVTQHIRPAVQYACLYWVHHLRLSTWELGNQDEVHTFLQHHFLHWLEVLSLMNRLSDAIEMISSLQPRTALDKSGHVATFLEDARRFVLVYRHIISTGPLQLYSSVISFAPQQSIVKNLCGRIPDWILRSVVTPKTWGPELQQLEGHTASVNSIAFSPDGRQVVSGSRDGTIRLWDTKTGQEIQQLQINDDSPAEWIENETYRALRASDVHLIRFMPDGRRIISVNSYSVTLWDARTGRQMNSQPIYCADRASLSPDGKILATVIDRRGLPDGREREIRLWDIETGQVLQNFTGFTDYISPFTFSPDGYHLAMGAYGDPIRLWNTETGRQIVELVGHEDLVSALEFSPDGQWLASGSFIKSAILLWSTKTWHQTKRLEGHDHAPCSMAFSPDGQQLVSGHVDGTMHLWNIEAGQNVLRLEGHTDSVWVMAFSPNGRQLASGSGDKTVRLWDTKHNHEVRARVYNHNAFRPTAFTPDGRLLASGFVGEVRLWDTETYQETQKIQVHNEYSISIAFSPDSRQMATLFQFGHVCLSDIQTRQTIKTFVSSVDVIEVFAFSSDGQYLISASDSEPAGVWDTETGEQIRVREDHRLPRLGRRVGHGYDYYCKLHVAETGEIVLNNELVVLDHNSDELEVLDDWIMYRDERLLWLPPAYRTDKWAVHGGLVALEISGHIQFIRLKPGEASGPYHTVPAQ